MSLIKKIIEFLKKIGVLKIGGTVKTYKSSKDKGYQIDVDPLDN